MKSLDSIHRYWFPSPSQEKLVYVLIASLISLGINCLLRLVHFYCVDEAQSASYDDLQPKVNKRNLVSSG